MQLIPAFLLIACAATALGGCATRQSSAPATTPMRTSGLLSEPGADPFPSTYRFPAAPLTLIRNATLLTRPAR